MAGYDVMIRIERQYPLPIMLFGIQLLPGYLCGSCNGKALHLDEVETLYSLGNAGTQAAGFGVCNR